MTTTIACHASRCGRGWRQWRPAQRAMHLKKRGGSGIVGDVWRVLRWVLSLVLWLVGLAGIPDDLKAWGRGIEMLDAWVDPWWVRALLAGLALILVTYPQWLPTVRVFLGIRDEGLAFTIGWWKAGFEIWRDDRKRRKQNSERS